MGERPAVELHDATISFKHFQLGPLDVEIKSGYITAVIGRNGAGKTTLLRLIANRLPLTDGKCTVFGTNFVKERSFLNERIAYVSHELEMYEYFTCGEAIAFVKAMQPHWSADLEKQLIEQLGIPLKRKIYELSKGMKLKLNLLFALAYKPRLLLLDEPTEGLDPIARRELLDLLRSLMIDEEQTIVLSSHVTSDLEQIADYVVFLHEGQIALAGEVSELKEAYRFFSASKGSKLDERLIVAKRELAFSIEGILRTEYLTQFSDLNTRLPNLDELLMYVVERGVTNVAVD